MNNNSIVCSTNNYSRSEAESRLKAKIWFNSSSKDLQKEVLGLFEEYNGFINDLSDRSDESMEFVILRMVGLFLADTTVTTVFEVRSKFTNKIYERTYMTYRRGRHHAMRGLVLIETNGAVSHFLARKCSRFEADKVVYESIGSIYAPIEIRQDKNILSVYTETELAKLLRVPKLTTSKYIDLGRVLPDGSITDLCINLYSMVIKVDDPNIFEKQVCHKDYDDRGYRYSFEMIPISEFFNFLSKTEDSYMLSIFGRLQALNVIKL